MIEGAIFIRRHFSVKLNNITHLKCDVLEVEIIASANLFLGGSVVTVLSVKCGHIYLIVTHPHPHPRGDFFN